MKSMGPLQQYGFEDTLYVPFSFQMWMELWHDQVLDHIQRVQQHSDQRK